MDCARVKELLVRFVDGECRPDEALGVEEHLGYCASCAGERLELERLDGALREAFRARAAEVGWDLFWPALRERLDQEAEEAQGLFDSWRRLLQRQRLAWAVPGAVLLVVGLFVFGWFFVGGENGAGVSNLTRVESIDSHGSDVAVFRISKDRTTVIWLFEETETDDESGVEPSRNDIP